MFDWQDLRYFLAAARLGSLSAAASTLDVDHATVGRRIARLEADIGVKLLVRLPRSIRLTEQGAALAEAGSAMGENAQAVIRHLRGQPAGLTGTVTVSALPAVAAFLIASSLTGFSRQHPHIRLILSANASVVSLERGDADIAIGFVRPNLPSRIVRRVGALQFGLYGTLTVTSRSEADWTFIGFEESLGDIEQQRWLDDFAAERPFVLRSNDVSTQAQAALSGLGIALLPCFLAETYTGLLRLRPPNEPPVRSLWMSVHADVRRSPAVRAVMDHLVTVLDGPSGVANPRSRPWRPARAG